MKKITIKALILSLSILFVPNTKCYAPIETVFIAGVIAMEVAGAIIAGIAGFIGYKVIKHAYSPEKQKKREERRKKRIAKKAERKRKREAKKSAGKKVGVQKESLIAT